MLLNVDNIPSSVKDIKEEEIHYSLLIRDHLRLTRFTHLQIPLIQQDTVAQVILFMRLGITPL